MQTKLLYNQPAGQNETFVESYSGYWKMVLSKSVYFDKPLTTHVFVSTGRRLTRMSADFSPDGAAGAWSKVPQPEVAQLVRRL